jgi:UMF1 family MFS transporter
MYDWANSAMHTMIVSAVFPIFFAAYAADGLPAATATFRYGIATTIALSIVAVLGPVLGAIADHHPIKLKMLRGFMSIGVVSVLLMFFIGQGQWLFAAVLFGFANIGVNGSFVFYDALLPHVAEREEIDRVSTAGYAVGYLGGGLMLAVCLLVIQNPAWLGIGPEASPTEASLPTRLGFVGVALWWAGFSIPLFRRVPEPRVRMLSEEERALGMVRAGFARLRVTVHELRRYRNAFLLLVAFLIYNDGIQTIIRMATIYGEELGIDRGAMLGAVLMVQFVGIPCAVLFGRLAKWIGAKEAIFAGLAVYVGIAVLGYYMQTALHFIILAGLVGMVQGGTQALSRSLFASMIPRHASGEYFGLFAVFEKFAGIAGPAVFALMIAVSGSSRGGVLSVVVFFVIGAVLLALVRVGEGRAAARAAEVQPSPAAAVPA